MPDVEKRIQQNEPKCGENLPLVFRNCTESIRFTERGDKIDLKLSFSDHISLTEFDPSPSVKRAMDQMARLGSFLNALGLHMEDIKYSHGWETFVERFIKMTKPKRGMQIYAKLTLNERGYLCAGSGRTFSQYPDLEYSDDDKQYLTQEPYESRLTGELP